MPATIVESEVLALEKRYWDALKQNDLNTMLSLTADPCLVVGKQGANTVNKTQFTQMMQSNEDRLRSYRLDESKATARQITPEVVAVAYPVHAENERKGAAQNTDSFDCSVWVRAGDTWKCAVHTETNAG